MYILPLTAEELEEKLLKISELDTSFDAAQVENGLIRVDVNYTVKDGSEVKFTSPADCSQITGLVVYYLDETGQTVSQNFVLSDARGNNTGDIDNLFAENAVVKAILNVSTGMAFVQNADTNAYLEERIATIENNSTKIQLITWEDDD